MDGFRLATAYVEVVPDATGFGERAQADLDKEHLEAKAKVTVDTTGLERAHLAAQRAALAATEASDRQAAAAAKAEAAQQRAAAASEKAATSEAAAAEAAQASADATERLARGEIDEAVAAKAATDATNAKARADKDAAAAAALETRAERDQERASIAVAAAKLQEAIATRKAADADAAHEAVEAKIGLNTAEFDAKSDETKTRLAELGDKEARPKVRLDDGDFKEKAAEDAAAADAVGASSSGAAPNISLLGAAIAGVVVGMPAFGGALAGIGASFGVLGLALSGVRSALSDYSQMQSTSAQTAAQLAATEYANSVAIRNAEQAIADARRQAAESAISNAEAVANAEQALQNAEISEQQAQVALTTARRDATLQLQQLNDEQKDATLGVKGAQLALEQAQLEQRRTNQNAMSTALERAQAELAVEQAQQALIEAQQRQTNATEAANRANKAGVEGSPEVIAAKNAERLALQAVANAQQALRDAVRNAANAQIASAEAIRKAIQALADTQREQALQSELSGNQAAKAFQHDMGLMSAAGQQLVWQLIGMRGAFHELEKAAQSAVLPGVTSFLRGVESLLPIISGSVQQMGHIVGGQFAAWGQALKSSGVQQEIRSILSEGAQFVQILGPALGRLGGAVLELWAKSGPAVAGFARGLASIADGFAGMFKAMGPAAGALGSGLATLGAAIGALGTPLGQIIAALDQALAPALATLLPPFEKLVSALGNALAPIITSLSPALEAFARVIAAIATAITPILPPLGLLIAQIGGELGKVLLATVPLIEGLLKALRPVLGLLVPLGKEFVHLVQVALDPLTKIIVQLTPFIVRVADDFAKFLAKGLQPMLPVIDALVTAFGQFLAALVPMMPQLEQFGEQVLQIMERALQPLMPMLPQIASSFVELVNKGIIPMIPQLAQLLDAFVKLLPTLLPLIETAAKITTVLLEIALKAIPFVINALTGVMEACQYLDGLWMKFAETMTKVVEKAFHGVGQAADDVATWVRKTWKGLAADGKAIWDGVALYFTGWWNDAKTLWRTSTEWLYQVLWKTWLGNLTSAITTTFTTLRSGARQLFGDLASIFQSGINALSSVWTGLGTVFKLPVNFLISQVYDNGIRKLWDDVTSAIGMSSINLPQVALLNTGGVVPGPNVDRDVVPAMLTPGERVLSRKEVASLGGHDAINRMVGRPQSLQSDGYHFNVGGIVNSIIGPIANLISSANWLTQFATNPASTIEHALDRVVSTTAHGEYAKMLTGIPLALIGKLANFASTSAATPGSGGALAMITLAKSQVGVAENPPGSNVQKYSTGLGRPAEAWCFAAGTLVDTPDGLKPIEQVTPGTEVLTPSGQVIATSRLLTREKELLRLTALGVPDTLATEDHPYWSMRRTSPAKHKRRLEPARWIPAGELRRGDMIALPVPAQGDEPFDAGLAYVLGMYVGDGHRLHRESALGVQFSDSADQRERIVAALKTAGYDDVRVSENRTCLHFTVYDQGLYRACEPFGDLAHGKRLPGEVFGWNRQAREAFLYGYLAGDGSFNDTTGHTATTVSRALVHGLGKLVRSLGHVPTVHRVREARPMAIGGRKVGTRPCYQITWKPWPNPRRQHFEQDGQLWVPVRSVTRTGRVDTVYDLTVPGEHAFIADGAWVSNCADFVDWVAKNSGNGALVPMTAGAAVMAQMFGSAFQGGSSGIAPGDIVFYPGATAGWDGIGHVGIAITGGSTWQSVEGNYGDHVALNSRSWAIGHARPRYPVGVAPGGSLWHASPQAAQAWAQQSLMGFGWGNQGQYQDLVNLWNRESGWRWDALNPSSGAYGIPQSLPADKMAAAGPDWHDNAATQMRWGLDYIKGRYGSPAGAWSHELSYNWYDQGGWFPSGTIARNATGRPEAVLTPDQSAALVRLADALAAAGTTRGALPQMAFNFYGSQYPNTEQMAAIRHQFATAIGTM